MVNAAPPPATASDSASGAVAAGAGSGDGNMADDSLIPGRTNINIGVSLSGDEKTNAALGLATSPQQRLLELAGAVGGVQVHVQGDGRDGEDGELTDYDDCAVTDDMYSVADDRDAPSRSSSKGHPGVSAYNFNYGNGWFAFPFGRQAEESNSNSAAAQAHYEKVERLLGSDFQKHSEGSARLMLSGMEKVIGVFFAASWCGPCRKFTP